MTRDEEMKRDQAKHLLTCDSCPVDDCQDCIAGPDVCTEKISKLKAWQFIEDAYITPKDKKRYEGEFKSALHMGISYTVIFNSGKISICRYHGADSESISFNGTASDFNQFDEIRPEEWFDVAAKMISGRAIK